MKNYVKFILKNFFFKIFWLLLIFFIDIIISVISSTLMVLTFAVMFFFEKKKCISRLLIFADGSFENFSRVLIFANRQKLSIFFNLPKSKN